MNAPWQCGPELDADLFRQVRRRAIFDCCKWQGTLCPFPLFIANDAWKEVSALALAMAAELGAAERALLDRFDLHGQLGLPVEVCDALRTLADSQATPGPVRTLRFDFHWTEDGWRISEANVDAVSGFIESSGCTELMMQHFPGSQTCGDPAGSLAGALSSAVRPGGVVGLMHLTVYSEDRQVMLYLARHFSECGLEPQLFSPTQLRANGELAIDTDWYRGPLDALFRFLPAEWVVQMPAETGWQYLAASGTAPVCNPLSAVLTQSKRFPLVWDDMDVALPTLRRLLPETRAPHNANWQTECDWVVKPALGHEGFRIGMAGVTTDETWLEIEAGLTAHPEQWVAQRRFATLPVKTRWGDGYPCLGVYVIGNSVAGAYGRLSPTPLIDESAWDIAVLMQDRVESTIAGDQ